jgi:hypothetical protein
VGPAPLPPHERSWRHPSELGPSITDVGVEGSGRGLVIATGAAAALLAAIMVVVLTPPRASAPTAITATTIASVSARGPNAPRTDSAGGVGMVRLNRNALSVDQTVTLSGAHNAIAAASFPSNGDYEPASTLPDGDTRLLVLYRSYVYEFDWRDADVLQAPDGAIVATRDGQMIAVFVDGEMRVVVR